VGALLEGAAVTVIDSATIAASPARTLADLLAGRAAGLNVTYPTGAPGYAPEITVRGSATIFGTGRPVLFIDGMEQREDRHLLGPALDRQRPSHMWSLPTEEIAEVRVLLGPTAGTLLPFGSARGAVLVRTKRGGRDRWTTRAFLESTVQPAISPFRSRRTTRGDVTGGGTTDFCPPTDVATGYCTATGTIDFEPFGGDSPFDRSVALRGGASASGDVRVASMRAGVHFDQAPTLTASNDWSERLDLSFTAESREWHGLTATLAARHARSVGRYAHWSENGLMQLGSIAVQPNDSTFSAGIRYADSILARALPYRTERTGATAQLRYGVAPGLDAWMDASTERVTRWSELKGPIVADSAGVPVVIGREAFGNDYRHGSGSATGGLRATGRPRPNLGLTGEIGASITNTDLRETRYDFAEIFGGGSAGSNSGFTPDIRSRSLFADARIELGANASISGGFRNERTRLFGRTFGDDPFNTFQAAWTISRARFFPRIPGVARVHLRGAYGESGDHEAVINAVHAYGFQPGPDAGAVPPRLQRTLEREAGADVDLLGGRVLLRATAFARALRDGYMNTNAPPTSGGAAIGFASWQTHGSEWTLALPARGTGALQWDATLNWSSARTRITQMWGITTTSSLYGYGRVKFDEGMPFGAVYAFGYDYSDANLDGIIDASEVTLTADRQRGVTQPTDLLGATVSLRWREIVSAGLTLDGKFGHVRYDATQRVTCSFLVCDDLYRTSATLAEQARAVVSGYAGTFTGPLDDGDFVRARDVWVRVALPARLRPFGLNGASVTLAVRNALAWDRTGHGDAETGSFVFGTVQRGDFYVPPLARQVSLRVDLAR